MGQYRSDQVKLLQANDVKNMWDLINWNPKDFMKDIYHLMKLNHFFKVYFNQNSE